MFSVDFFADINADLHLAEYAIQYSAMRQDGINLAVTFLLTPHDRGNFYVVFPRNLENAALASLDQWQNGYSSAVPYSYLFSNVAEERARIRQDGSALVRPFECDHLSGEGIESKLVTPEDTQITDVIPHEDNDLARLIRPYTLLRVGTLESSETPLLFRVEGHVPASSYSDLVTENDDKLAPGVLHEVKVWVAKTKKISYGDKISGRHG